MTDISDAMMIILDARVIMTMWLVQVSTEHHMLMVDDKISLYHAGLTLLRAMRALFHTLFNVGFRT